MAKKWLSYFNRVKSRLKIDRSFFKDARVAFKIYCYYKFGAGRRPETSPLSRTIAFYPNPVGSWYNIWMAVQNTDLHITKSVQNADYVFIFDDITESSAAQNMSDSVNGTLINHRITDISKTHVGHVFLETFGYALEVDPTVYEGQVVEKSDENGTHDGRLINCPIDKSALKPDCCYQKFIDSSFTGEFSEDLRIATVFGDVAAVFHKHKAFDKRFSTSYLSTTVKTADAVFSPKELRLIQKFCAAIGLDFGAIDVLRDKHDGRIYIVDVNKTCMPVMSLPFSEQIRSHAMIGNALQKKLNALEISQTS